MKKRILVFSLVYYPNFIGGAEVAVKEITDRLGNDFEFDMVTVRSKGELKQEKVGNVNVYRTGLPFLGLTFNKYFFLLSGFVKALFLNRKKKYDAMWSMMATYNSFAALFFKLFNKNIPFLLTLQEGDPIPFIKRRARPLWPLFRMIFSRADHIQTISQYLADFATEMQHLKKSGHYAPVTVVPNGVDVAHFSQVVPEGEKQKLKEEMHKKESDVVLITASRLVKKNAVGDIIDALVYLPTNYKLIICGVGKEEAMLQSKVAEHDFLDRVEFAGFVPHERMPEALSVADVFIRPSLSEGFGNVFVEAMAARVPVITTPVGGIVDFLKDGETGLFCRVSDPKSIADKVLELTSNPELRNKIIQNAFQMVQEKYDWDNLAVQMSVILHKDLIQ